MAKKVFWYKSFTCPLCGEEFETVRVFSSAIAIKERDVFLRPTYRGVNPDWYNLVTCPSCYFSAFENDFETILARMNFKALEDLRRSLERARKNLSPELGEDRNAEDAHIIDVLGLLTYMKVDMAFKMAQILLKMGWYYLDKKDMENAAITYSKALKQFERSFGEDKKGQHSDAIMFYIASLNIQLNHTREGFKWLEKLVRDYRGTNSHFIKAGQKLWEDIRGNEQN
ncbi:MAG TPA: DUF2225 domain-containing protein [Thermotogota bacterium]|nr:DUF2225 domain-containing protein [Thermotogota bacterium]HPJ88419.1 DUF2225 domain-containing protein [Thermotogota bacterium]HPR95414.1 DUF2225 domain-containing protein [Thermotogota bacterium]